MKKGSIKNQTTRNSTKLNSFSTIAKENNSSNENIEQDDKNDIQTILDRLIDEEYIIKHTGKEDLSTVFELKLTIDTSIQSAYDLGNILSNLKTLILDESNVQSVRDLGTNLRSMTCLSLISCKLNDLDGIGALINLEVLNVSYNNLNDVTPLAMHDVIEDINLSGNRLSNLNVADSLSSCPNLKSVTLLENPIASLKHYKAIISYLIPNLTALDSQPIVTNTSFVTNSVLAEAVSALTLMEEEFNDTLRLEEDFLNQDNHHSLKNNIHSPTKSSKNQSNHFNYNSVSVGSVPDTGSELTHGSTIVLAGNVAAAMRKRKNNLNNSQESKIMDENKSKNTSKNDTNDVEFESTLDLLDAALISSNNIIDSRSTNAYLTNSPFLREGDITEYDKKYNKNKNIQNKKLSIDTNNNDEVESTNKINFELKLNIDKKVLSEDNNSNRRPKTATPLSSSSKQRNNSNSSIIFAVDSPINNNNNNNNNNLRVNSRPQSANSTNMSNSRPNTSREYTNSDFSLPFKVSIHPRKDDGSQHKIQINYPNNNIINNNNNEVTIADIYHDTITATGTDDTIIHEGIYGNNIRIASKKQLTEKESYVSRTNNSTKNDDNKSNKINHFGPIAMNQSWFRSSNANDTSYDNSNNINSNHINNNINNINNNINNINNNINNNNSFISSSIIHKDIVKRNVTNRIAMTNNNRRLSHELINPLRYSSSSFMNDQLINSINNNNNNNNINNSRGSFASSNRGDSRSESRGSMELNTNASNTVTKNTQNNNRMNQTISSMVGKSLGFNLQGSLAAIDKWVQDMNSSEEEEDENDNDDVNNNNKKTNDFMIMKSRHFIDKNANSDNEEDPKEETSNSESNTLHLILYTSQDTLLACQILLICVIVCQKQHQDAI
eukprot:gene9977-13422_t